MNSVVIVVVKGDITKIPVDAIVNAANPAMLGGGGVDGAIHRAAGPGLRDACARHQPNSRGERCPTGEVVLTGSYNLPSLYVIHTVGPDVRDNYEGDSIRDSYLLSECYRKSIKLAESIGLESISFPMISCGVYGFDPVKASAIAVDTIRRTGTKMEVYLVAFSDDDLKILIGAILRPHLTTIWSDMFNPIVKWFRSKISE